MKTATKISGELRRSAIIKAATQVFIRKGFNGTTTRELAGAAGVSEALLFKHFTNKEAIYAAVLNASFQEEVAELIEWAETITPSTESLVTLVQRLVAEVMEEQPDEGAHSFFRLAVRSLLDDAEFARRALQGLPLEFAHSVSACLTAAKAADDMLDTPVRSDVCGWLVHYLIAGLLIHSLPGAPVIDCDVSRQELVSQLVWFCLTGMGLKTEVIERCLQERA